MDTGRWTIVARATPHQRRPSQPYLRARVHVRCVCGLERIVWLEDIEAGRSTGCESRRCHARYQASLDVRVLLGRWLAGELEALSQLVHEASEAERDRVAQAIAAARAAELDEAITEYLRAPLADYLRARPMLNERYREA